MAIPSCTEPSLRAGATALLSYLSPRYMTDRARQSVDVGSYMLGHWMNVVSRVEESQQVEEENALNSPVT